MTEHPETHSAKRYVYLDHAATTPLRQEALEAMMPFLNQHYGNASAIYDAGLEAGQALQKSRSAVAGVIGASPEEIYFVSGATEANNWMMACSLDQPRAHAVISAIEHPSILRSCKAMEKKGVKITWVQPDQQGIIHPRDVEAALRPDTALISVMMANNEIGTIQPIRKIGCMAQAYHIPFHTDAVQALGHIPVNVNDLQVDYLSASAHKLYGPKGIGFLYMRRGKALSPLLYGGAQERNRRAGTENVAAAVGFARALILATTEMAQEATRQIQIRDALIIQLASLGCRLNGDPQCRLPNNVHVLLPGWEGEKMVRALNRRGFAVSSGSACASGSPEPSHVLRAIGLSHEQAFEGLRITIGRKTTMQDAAALVQTLTDILHENSSQ